MTPLLRLAARRDLTRHRIQAGLTVAGVALGVAVVVAVDLAGESARRAFALSSATVAGRATHQVTAGTTGLPETWYASLRREAGLRAAAPVVEADVVVGPLPGRAARLLGVDPLAEPPLRPWLVADAAGAARLLPALLATPGAALVSEQTAAALGLQPGDRVPLLAGARADTVRVIGLLRAADAFSREALAGLVVVDLATAQEMLGRPGRLDRVDFVLPADDGGKAAAALVARLPAGATLAPAGARAGAFAALTRAFRLNLAALSLLALVVGMFLVANTMAFSVVRRRPLLGALRALGVTRRELLGLVLGEALAIGAIATAAGLAGGLLLARGLTGLVTRTLNDLYFTVAVTSVTPAAWTLAKAALVGLAATLAAALAPAWDAASVPARVAGQASTLETRLRALLPRLAAAGTGLLGGAGALLLIPSRDVAWAYAAVAALLLGWALLTPSLLAAALRPLGALAGAVAGPLGALAARGISARLSRAAVATAALVVATAAALGTTIMVHSFRGTVAAWLEATLHADVYVTLPEPRVGRSGLALPRDLPARLATAPGVAGLITNRMVEVQTDRGPSRLAALDVGRRAVAATVLAAGRREGLYEAFRAGAAIVTEPYAWRHRIGPGDTLTLRSPRGPVPLRVAAVVLDYGSEEGLVYVHRSLYDRWWDDPDLTAVGVYAAPGVSAAALARDLQARAGDAPLVFRSHRDLREAALAVFDRTFAVTTVLQLLAGAVAVIGVFSALLALQLERARETAVLRAIGLTPAQVFLSGSTQTGLLGLVAGALALPPGVALAAVLTLVINRRSFGWSLALDVPGTLLLRVLALAAAAALLAGLWPAWRAARQPPAAALREG